MSHKNKGGEKTINRAATSVRIQKGNRVTLEITIRRTWKWRKRYAKSC